MLKSVLHWIHSTYITYVCIQVTGFESIDVCVYQEITNELKVGEAYAFGWTMGVVTALRMQDLTQKLRAHEFEFVAVHVRRR